MSRDPIIGRRLFADGSKRDVYLDGEGQAAVVYGSAAKRDG